MSRRVFPALAMVAFLGSCSDGTSSETAERSQKSTQHGTGGQKYVSGQTFEIPDAAVKALSNTSFEVANASFQDSSESVALSLQQSRTIRVPNGTKMSCKYMHLGPIQAGLLRAWTSKQVDIVHFNSGGKRYCLRHSGVGAACEPNTKVIECYYNAPDGLFGVDQHGVVHVIDGGLLGVGFCSEIQLYRNARPAPRRAR